MQLGEHPILVAVNTSYYRLDRINCRLRKWRLRKEMRKIRAGFRALEPILGRIFGL